jgi:hypothetical protein
MSDRCDSQKRSRKNVGSKSTAKRITAINASSQHSAGRPHKRHKSVVVSGNTTLSDTQPSDVDDFENYDAESSSIVCNREQLVDIETLWRHACSLGDYPHLKAEKIKCKKLIEKCEIVTNYSTNAASLIGKVNVEYRHQIVEARIYPARYNWCNEIFNQSNKSGARAAAGGRIYIDLDIENCFPVFLEFLCDKHSIPAPNLRDYNANREAYIQSVIVHYQPTGLRQAAKSLFSAGYNGAGKDFVSNWRIENLVDTSIAEHEFVVEFFQQNSDVARTLITQHYSDVLTDVKSNMPHKKRPVQTALHCVLARMETRCRDTMERIANAQTISTHVNIRMDSLQHDGAYFRVDTPLDVRDWYAVHEKSMRAFNWEKLCDDMSNAIKTKHGYPVRVTVKKGIQVQKYNLTSVFRQSDFMCNLPLRVLMDWMNRHFVMMSDRGNNGVVKLRYAPGSEMIANHVTEAVASFQVTFAGMMMQVPILPKVSDVVDESESFSSGESETDADDAISNNVQAPKFRSVDLAAHWCRSGDRRNALDIIFEPMGIGTGRDVNPDYVNLFCGLPYDKYLECGSTLEINNNVSQLVEPIAPGTAAYIALNRQGVAFKEPVPKGAAFILKHIQETVCGGDLDACMYLIRSLSYMYRFRTKTGVLIIILGEQGIGKSTIFGKCQDKIGLIPRLYSKHWKEVGGIGELFQTFADKQELECMFVTIEEANDMGCVSSAMKSMGPRLKQLLTSGTKSHQLKHQTADSHVKDYRNFVALINPDRKNAFKIESGDRRFAMIEASDRYSKLALDEGRISAGERKEYFAELWRSVEDEDSVQWLVRYLSFDVDLNGWTPEDIPNTKVRTELQELNVCPILRFLRVWRDQPADDYELFYVQAVETKGIWEDTKHPLESCGPLEKPRLYKVANLLSAFKDWCQKSAAGSDMIRLSENAFAQTLAKYVQNATNNPMRIVHKKLIKVGTRYWMNRPAEGPL